jgi:hypothetical protein
LNPRPRECHSRALPLSYGPRFIFKFKLKFFFVKQRRGTVQKKSPYIVPPSAHFFVLPRGSEASLTSFGMASPGRPLACARGDKKVGSGRHFPLCHPEARKCRGTPRLCSGRQKRCSEQQKSRLRMDKNGRG